MDKFVLLQFVGSGKEEKMEHLADLAVGRRLENGFLLERSFDFALCGALAIHRFDVLTIDARFPGMLIARLENKKTYYGLVEPAELPAEVRSCEPFLRNASQWP